MRSVERLLAEFVEEYRAGGRADPVAYLGRAPAGERRHLAVLIDAYLMDAPPRPADAGDQALVQASLERLHRTLAGVSGGWPELLPRLRAGARLRRSELVARLAATLGVEGRRDKVAAYYHGMEQGLLPASGVSDRVLAALASLTGTTVEALREAGSALVERGEGAGPPAPAFARMVPAAEPSGAPARTRSEPGAEEDPWDEVDELFRGGA